MHDFPDPEVPKAIPFGVYDIGAHEGFVVVGDDHDTAAFAVATIGRWSDMVGQVAYPAARRLLSPPTPGGRTATGCGCGRSSSVALPPAPASTHGVPLPARTSKWNQIVLYTGFLGVYEVTDEPAPSPVSLARTALSAS